MVIPQVVRWHIYPDEAELAETASSAILRIANQAIAERGEYLIVLSGGKTPKAIYERLAESAADWTRWKIYFGDERCLPVDHPDRNSVMAATAWLGRVTIPREQIFQIPAERGSEAGAEAYQKILAGVGSFDLVLLGLGEDGHTASLFPGHDWGEGAEEISVLPVQGAPKPPGERVSLSAFRLSHARQVLVFASGAAKAPAVTAWRSGQNLPIAAVRAPTGVDALLTLDVWP